MALFVSDITGMCKAQGIRLPFFVNWLEKNPESGKMQRRLHTGRRKKQMDNSVIKKLADIDRAARSILADAEEEKKKLAEEYREQTEKFDRETDLESDREIEKVRSDLEREKAAITEKSEADLDHALAFIEKKYAGNVDVRADEIVARILEA